MADLELIVLGSASGMPDPDRAHASLALRRGGDLWLLDAGEGVSGSMLRWGLDPLEIREIYITHCHPDHCAGLFMILQYLHMRGSTQQVNIYLPGGAIPAFQKFMDQVYLVNGVINPRYNLIPLEDKHHLADELTLESFPTRHLQSWQELDLPDLETRSYAFRVYTPHQSFFYSGDIREIADIEDHLHADDLLILEAAHINFGSVLGVTRAAGVKRLLLTHALPEMTCKLEDLKVTAKKYHVELQIARDGVRLSP